jgi:DNA mismatch repair protein MutL
MSIEILPPEVASQIAAGEVVERPASVVKELIENSLDAGSSHISISVESGGQQLIEVIDDGQGIPADELSLSVERHATSKLKIADDLNKIQTLGFRGEALASIGSIARLTITTRTTQSDYGSRIKVEGGIIRPLEPVGTPVGCIVRVEDLFYNVPARRKFLKKETTERRYIDSLVGRYALAYPQTRFNLMQEGRQSLQTSGNGKHREILAGLYGVELARQLLEVSFEEENIKISGFISPTNVNRSNRHEIIFFVNRRPVQDVALVSAVIKAYHTLLMVGRYPVAFLFIELPAQLLDVNVHPTKAEVRFSKPGWVFSNMQRVVRRTLLAYSPIPEANAYPQWGNHSQSEDSLQTSWDYKEPIPRSDHLPGELTTGGELTKQQEVKRMPLLRLVGQIAAAYLVAEGPDGLYLIDQHAAHERILFEKYLAQQKEKVSSQALLQPVTVTLHPAQARVISEQLLVLQQMGFEIEPFGPSTYQVRAVPDILLGMDPEAALRVLVEEFEEDETPLQAHIEQKIIARICKRAAVKAGKLLSEEEQRALINDLERCASPRTCPHGRPTMIHLSVNLLEKQFGRQGAR